MLDEIFSRQKIMSKTKIWINNKFSFLDNRFSFFSLYVLQYVSYGFVTKGQEHFKTKFKRNSENDDEVSLPFLWKGR